MGGECRGLRYHDALIARVYSCLDKGRQHGETFLLPTKEMSYVGAFGNVYSGQAQKYRARGCRLVS